jgi:hypothetical protein
MPDIEHCLVDALEQTKKQLALLEAQRRLLGNVYHELKDIRLEQKQPCASILKECLFNIDELFTLFYIHPSKREEFDAEMLTYKYYAQLIGSHSYFSLFKLIASESFLASIAPLTLYYLGTYE